MDDEDDEMTLEEEIEAMELSGEFDIAANDAFLAEFVGGVLEEGPHKTETFDDLNDWLTVAASKKGPWGSFAGYRVWVNDEEVVQGDLVNVGLAAFYFCACCNETHHLPDATGYRPHIHVVMGEA